MGGGMVLESITIDTQGHIQVLPPRTAEEILARERERKARTTLLMALPEDHLAKFHKMTDAKEMWDAIKSRFGGNDESKKMQKYILKQQFEGFSVSNSEGLHKGYDRFQSLLSQLEIHEAVRTKGNQDNRRRDAWNSRNKDGRRSGKQEDSKALVTIDGEGVDWTSHSEEEEDYALMACNSSGSDTEVTSCSNECKESYAKLKKLYDAQREQLSDASIEIKAYTQGLKKVEAQLVAHQQGQLWSMNKYSEDEHVSLPTEEQETPSFANQQVKTPRESIKNKFTYSKNSTFDKKGVGYGFITKACFVCGSLSHLIRDCDFHEKRMAKQAELNNMMSKKSNQREIRPIWNNVQRIIHTELYRTNVLYIVDVPGTILLNGKRNSQQYGFITKACFVCGSLSHLIRDCDFHEKRMAKQAELNNRMSKKSNQREIRPIWNNVQRVNHKNQFFPTAVLTKTGKILVNTARTSGTNNVSTARHNFNSQAVLTNAGRKISTVKPFVDRVRPKTVFHKTHSPFSRPFNNTTALRTNFSYQKVNTAKNKGIVDSGCSRHMTRNKAYLAEYQDFNGGPVAFGGSKGYITGKVLVLVEFNSVETLL
ncbi:hypothetical protein Tco_1155408 [Tanacetum coccineum]